MRSRNEIRNVELRFPGGYTALHYRRSSIRSGMQENAATEEDHEPSYDSGLPVHELPTRGQEASGRAGARGSPRRASRPARRWRSSCLHGARVRRPRCDWRR